MLAWNPGPPMPLLAKGQGPKPDGAAGPGSLEGWLAGSSCCLAQHTASGLNVTSRRSQDGRGSVAEAQVQKGRADLAPLPPPSPPPSWWRVSSGNRGFRKTELLARQTGANSLRLRHAPAAGSTCGLPPPGLPPPGRARPSAGKSSPRGREGGHMLLQHRQSWPSAWRGSLCFETIQGQRELRPFKEKEWGPQVALGCFRDPCCGHLPPPSLLPPQTPAAGAAAAPRRLKVNWVELWS